MKNELIRNAQLTDVRRIWEIRNHPQVRKQAFTKDIIDFTAHEQWYEQELTKADHYFYVLEIIHKQHGYVIGYCRYANNINAYNISIAIDPAFQGKGSGYQLLTQTLRYMKTRKKEIQAKVNKQNHISQKFFLKAGFTIDSNYDNQVIMHYI